MVQYGFAAVRDSMQALELHVAERRLPSKLMLRAAHALMTIKRLGGQKAA